MRGQVEARRAALQAEMQQTQHALSALEQERQRLLQGLVGQQYSVQVLTELLAESAAGPPDAVTYDPALGFPVAP